MIITTSTIGIIGVGVMGRTLIEGLLNSGHVNAEQLWATAKTEASCRKAQEQLGIRAVTRYTELLPATDILLLCVKPSKVEEVIKQLKKARLAEKTLIISIVAGVSTETLEKWLAMPSTDNKNPVIRAMPNTPAVVGQAMTLLCKGSLATTAQGTLAETIFRSVGDVLELEESHFDAVTGLGGSGPAYLYLIMEALADGGVRVGLPREVALRIVAQTVLGAATMVQKTGRHPAALRDDVTTPAGCTIAGLLALEDGKIRSVLSRAVEEATMVASQLGKTK